MNNLNDINLICGIIDHLKEGKITLTEEDCDPSAFIKGILMYLEENRSIFITPGSVNRFMDSLIDYYKSELEHTISHINSMYGLFPSSYNPGPGIRGTRGISKASLMHDYFHGNAPGTRAKELGFFIPAGIKDSPDTWNPETDGYRCMSYPSNEDLLDKIKSEGVSTKYTRATMKHKGLTELSLKLFNRLPVDYDEYYRVYYCYTSDYCVARDEKIYEPDWLKDQPESWGLISEKEEKIITEQVVDGLKRGIESLEGKSDIYNNEPSFVERMSPDEQREYMRKMDLIREPKIQDSNDEFAGWVLDCYITKWSLACLLHPVLTKNAIIKYGRLPENNTEYASIYKAYIDYLLNQDIIAKDENSPCILSPDFVDTQDDDCTFKDYFNFAGRTNLLMRVLPNDYKRLHRKNMDITISFPVVYLPEEELFAHPGKVQILPTNKQKQND